MARKKQTSPRHNLHHFLRWLRPSPRETLGYIVISFGLGVAVRLSDIQSLDPISQHGLTVLFWMIAGAVMYCGYWLTRNFYDEIASDIAVARARKSSAARWQPFAFTFENGLFRVSIAFLFVCYGVFQLGVVTPMFINTVKGAVDSSGFHITPASVLARVGFVISLHGYVILARLLVVRKRLLVRYL